MKQAHHQAELPPLPEPAGETNGDVFGHASVPLFTADQMRAYALAALSQPQQAEPVAEVVSSGPANFPLLRWLSADISLNTPIGSKLYTAPQQAAAAPAGFKLVPVEPTVQMINAGECGCMDNDVTVSIYRAMLAAAPEATAAAQAVPVGFWQSMDPWLVEFIGKGVGLVEKLYNDPASAIDCSRTGDWMQTAIELMKKAHQNGAAPQQAAAGEALTDERARLRAAQADAVMPMIGPLLDAWENADREVMDEEPDVAKWLTKINAAMETAGDECAAQASQPQPVREPLTEEQVHKLYLELNAKVATIESALEMFTGIVRDVERAHGITK